MLHWHPVEAIEEIAVQIWRVAWVRGRSTLEDRIKNGVIIMLFFIRTIACITKKTSVIISRGWFQSKALGLSKNICQHKELRHFKTKAEKDAPWIGFEKLINRPVLWQVKQ